MAQHDEKESSSRSHYPDGSKEDDMNSSRVYSFGLAALLAVGAESAPVRACTGVTLAPVTDTEVVALGTDLVPVDSRPGLPDIGGNVTVITHFHNLTTCAVTIEKVDGFAGTNRDQAITLGQLESADKSMWVPWAGDWNSPQRLTIRFDGDAYFEIWQKDGRLVFRTVAPYLRLSDQERRDRYDYGLSVPGLTREGGPRQLHIAMTSDGRPYFRVDGIPK
jgi:hypothetical protein